MTPNMARHGNRCPILTLTMQGAENIVWISTNPHWYLLPARLDGWVWRAYELVPVPPAGGHLVQNTCEQKPTKIKTDETGKKTKLTLTILYFVIWEGRQWFLSVELVLKKKRIKDIYRSLLFWSILTSSVSGWGFQRPSMARMVLVRNMTHLRVANFFQLNSKFCYLSKWKSLHFFTLTSTSTQESNPFGFLVTSHSAKAHFASALDFLISLSFTQL